MDESCKGDDQENDQPDKDVPLLPIGNEKDLLPCFIVEGEEAPDPFSEKNDGRTGAVSKVRIYNAANSENDDRQQEEQDPKIARRDAVLTRSLDRRRHVRSRRPAMASAAEAPPAMISTIGGVWALDRLL